MKSLRNLSGSQSRYLWNREGRAHPKRAAIPLTDQSEIRALQGCTIYRNLVPHFKAIPICLYGSAGQGHGST